MGPGPPEVGTFHSLAFPPSPPTCKRDCYHLRTYRRERQGPWGTGVNFSCFLLSL